MNNEKLMEYILKADIRKADVKAALQELIGETGSLDDIVEVINKKFDVRNFNPDARGSHYKGDDDVIRFGLPIDVICVKTEGEGKETKFEVKSVELAEDKIKKADIKKQSILTRFNEATNRVYGVIGILENDGIITEADRREFTKVVDMLADKIKKSERQRELSTATEFL